MAPARRLNSRPPLLALPRARAAVAALCALTAACGASGPLDHLPPGASLSARREGLERLLAQLETLEGTPAARRARALGRTLPDCAVLEAHTASGSLADALLGLGCQSSDLEALHAFRGARDLAFAWSISGRGRAIAGLTVGARGALELEIELPRDAFADARALLVPGSEPPGPGVLSGSEILAHARLRPDRGLGIAALVPEDSQGAQLFRLKSELFAGTVLDGTWEVALYLPEPGASMPLAALAVGFAQREMAVATMESFLRDLQRSWPLRRSYFAAGEASGACLLDLNILPELAPCYVATERALVVGWNPASIRKALDGAAVAHSEELPETGGLVIDLARFREADARLAKRPGAGDRWLPPTYPWGRVLATGRSAGHSARLRVHFVPREGA